MFVPHVRSKTITDVALPVDNACSHNELCDLIGQVHVIPLPRNVTAVHQPMDMGVTSVFKRMYRKQMLRELVRDIKTKALRRATSKGRAGSMIGLAEGYDPHILDVTKLIKKAWDSVS